MPDISQINLPGDNNTYNIADIIARGRIWQGTQAQYNALTTIDPDTVYFITDAAGTVLATVATTGSYNDLTDKPQIDISLDTTSSNAIANGPVASAVQTISQTVSGKMDKANPTGTGSLSLNRKANTPEGNQSVAVGYNNEASGATATAENSTNKASGSQSHCEGYGNEANHLCQHVFGQYNKADTSTAAADKRGNYVEIVGNGMYPNSRSNARTLDWNGNETLAGGLKVHETEDVTCIKSFTNDITTTADGLAAVTIPSGVGINNIFAIIVQNPAGVYLYGFLIKQPSALWADIRQFNGTAYASQNCTIRLFYYVI